MSDPRTTKPANLGRTDQSDDGVSWPVLAVIASVLVLGGLAVIYRADHASVASNPQAPAAIENTGVAPKFPTTPIGEAPADPSAPARVFPRP